ncbi:MAG: hypothetical protein H6534_04140 [Chthonomonadaceae bacterium]|nr:hypothetical protein [Chthonomonadaceae bacterium]
MTVARRTFALLLAMTPGWVAKGSCGCWRATTFSAVRPRSSSSSEEALREEYRLSAKPARTLAQAAPRKLVDDVRRLEERLDRLGSRW